MAASCKNSAAFGKHRKKFEVVEFQRSRRKTPLFSSSVVVVAGAIKIDPRKIFKV